VGTDGYKLCIASRWIHWFKQDYARVNRAMPRLCVNARTWYRCSHVRTSQECPKKKSTSEAAALKPTECQSNGKQFHLYSVLCTMTPINSELGQASLTGAMRQHVKSNQDRRWRRHSMANVSFRIFESVFRQQSHRICTCQVRKARTHEGRHQHFCCQGKPSSRHLHRAAQVETPNLMTECFPIRWKPNCWSVPC